MEPILMVSSILLWIVVLFNLLLTVALIRRNVAKHPGFDMENVPTLEIGSQAPDFTAETLNGKIVSLADYAGRPVIFVFISPTCQPCFDKLPALQAMGQEAQQFGVELILVNAANRMQTQEFVNEYDIALPILSAPRGSNPFLEDYRALGTPFYCFVDEQRQVQATAFLDSNLTIVLKAWVETRAIEGR